MDSRCAIFAGWSPICFKLVLKSVHLCEKGAVLLCLARRGTKKPRNKLIHDRQNRRPAGEGCCVVAVPQWRWCTRCTCVLCSGSTPWAQPPPLASRMNCPPANMQPACSSETVTCAISSSLCTTSRIVVSVSGTGSDMLALSRVYDFTCCDIEPAVIGEDKV